MSFHFKKIANWLVTNYPWVLALILLIVPFFWFRYGEIDLGGDSTRLYFFDPQSWLGNVGLYSPSTLHSTGVDDPNYCLIPFLALLVVLKSLLSGNPYFLNCFFNGLLLSGGFSFAYLAFKDMTESESKTGKLCSVIGALFFVLSPLVIYEWQKALYSFNQILVYPLVFYLFLKYLKTRRSFFIFLALIVTFIFSVNFSYPTFPWFLAFFSFACLFLFLYSLVNGTLKVLIKGLGLFVGLFFAIQAFHLFPQLSNVLNFSNPNSQAIFSQDLAVNRGLSYFLSVQPFVRLTYNLLDQPQLLLAGSQDMFDFGLKYRYLFYAYILVVILGGLLAAKFGNRKEKKLYFIMALIFWLLCFWMTANITNLSLALYKKLFLVPGFSMYRSFYTKFALTYVYFYGLILSYSLFLVFKFTKNTGRKVILVGGLLFLIIFSGWPLLSGKIVNSLVWRTRDVRLPIEIDDSYLTYLKGVSQRKLDGKYVSFPLANESYQVLKGKNGGAYFGPSIVASLAGKNDFDGLDSFIPFRNEITEALENNKEVVAKYFSFLSIRYLFYNSDDYIYQKLEDYPYPSVLKSVFPTQKEIGRFVENLNWQPIQKIANFSLYLNADFLPHFYTAKKVVSKDLPLPILTNVLKDPNYDQRTVILLGQTDKLLSVSDSPPVIEYKKVNPTKYQLVLHQAKGGVGLVFNESFNQGWEMSLEKVPLPYKVSYRSYTIFPENEIDQASQAELEDYLTKGWISALAEKPKFVSKNFQGTIQNDNLAGGNVFETLVSRDKLFSFPESSHYTANGYANFWFIDTGEICQNKDYCRGNADGTFDLALVIEFHSQTLFYFSSLVTILALVICFIGIVVSWRVRKR